MRRPFFRFALGVEGEDVSEGSSTKDQVAQSLIVGNENKEGVPGLFPAGEVPPDWPLLKEWVAMRDAQVGPTASPPTPNANLHFAYPTT